MDPVTVTVEHARKAIGIGNTTLYKLIGEGKLKTVKVGRRTLVQATAERQPEYHRRATPVQQSNGLDGLTVLSS